MLFDRMMNRPMQSFGMGQTYVPDSGFDGGDTGGASFRMPHGIVPPHMQTGGGGQMQPMPFHLNTGGPSQQFAGGRMPSQAGGPGQMFPMHPAQQFNPWAAFLGRGY
jgi:hypothetical protein